MPKITPKRNKLFNEIADLAKAHNVFNMLGSFDSLREADKIVQIKGKGFIDYYDAMIDADSVLSGLVETRIGAVVGLEWEMISASAAEEDKELAEFCRFAIEGISNFDADLYDIMGAMRNGFSATEIIWKDTTWQGRKVVVPDKLLSRNPERFRFNLEGDLFLRTQDDWYTGINVTKKYPFRFLVHSFQPRYQNPYGVSLLRSVWWPWWFKHNTFKYWLQAAEAGAVVTPVLYYPEHSTEDEIAVYASAARKFLKSKYIVVPEGGRVEFPQIKIDKAFAEILVNRCNSEMRYRILGSTHSTGVEGGGSRALAEVHDRRFQERIEMDSKSLATTLNTQLIIPTVLFNFREPEVFPKWKLRYELPKDAKIVGESLKLAAELGIPVSLEAAADLLQLPMAEEGEPIIGLNKTEPLIDLNEATPEEEDAEQD